MHTDDYVVSSLELHLFFGRIMKEHSLFLRAGFTPANESFSKQAEVYKREFETLLALPGLQSTEGSPAVNYSCATRVAGRMFAPEYNPRYKG